LPLARANRAHCVATKDKGEVFTISGARLG
jgi:hypothetical protein